MNGRVFRWRASGFTLIELLIVILIIGILAGLTVGVVNIARRKGDDAKARSMINALDQGLELYKSNNGYLPGRGSPVDPFDPESNVISDVLEELRGEYCKISEGDLGVIEAEGEPPRVAAKEEINDSGIPKVIIDPWGWSYIARENESKDKKRDWMRNRDFIDLYSWGPNEADDTIEPTEGRADDDIGNW